MSKQDWAILFMVSLLLIQFTTMLLVFDIISTLQTFEAVV